MPLRVLAAILALALAGCGSGEEEGEAPPLTISAAASLAPALERYAEAFDARLSFGGSDALAAQIRRGVRPDVFAAAETDLPRLLHEEGLLEKPVVFAANEMVVAVRPRSKVGSLSDLGLPGVKIAVGAPTVPVGEYAEEVLRYLGEPVRRNVRSREPDVNGIVAKVAAGAADAGLVYRTDVLASEGRLRAIELPPRLQPRIRYAAAVVDGARSPEAARRFVRGLRGARALRKAGFGNGR